MEKQINKLKRKFINIKDKGWIKSIRSGNTGIGMTFEYLLGIEENNLEISDYNGIEIKTKRNYSNSYTTLFNYTPEGKHYHEIERLKNIYGYPDKDNKNYKILNNSIYSNIRTWIGTKYQFKLNVDKVNQKIYLCIFDSEGTLIEKNVYWDFDIIKEKLYRKVKTIAFISALRKFINKEEYFKYYKMTIYSFKDFDTFINLIEKGIIRITFKIGVFKTGKRTGQIHDHGTGFDIKEKDMHLLYDIYNV